MTGSQPSNLFPGSPLASEIATEGGETWEQHRKILEPAYGSAWRDIALCYAMLVGGYSLTLAIDSRAIGLAFAAGPLIAAWLGYWLVALVSFGHEGVHLNLARQASANDRIANWLTLSWVGQDVKNYRRSHWQHHLRLGKHGDTEISYHHCISTGFIFALLTGSHWVEFLTNYSRRMTDGASGSTQTSRTTNRQALRRSILALTRAVAFHSFVLGLALWHGRYVSAGVWVAAVVIFFPLLGALRQTMEHRRLEAPCLIDFSQVEHGPVNRMFGTDFFSRYYGAAGFNRHLLHHWDPEISYTLFDEMEAFIARTPLADKVEEARTIYPDTFKAMLATARNG